MLIFVSSCIFEVGDRSCHTKSCWGFEHLISLDGKEIHGLRIMTLMEVKLLHKNQDYLVVPQSEEHS